MSDETDEDTGESLPGAFRLKVIKLLTQVRENTQQMLRRTTISELQEDIDNVQRSVQEIEEEIKRRAEDEETSGLFSAYSFTVSDPKRVVGLVVIIAMIVVGLITLAMYDVQLPFISGKAALLLGSIRPAWCWIKDKEKKPNRYKYNQDEDDWPTEIPL